VLVIFDSGIVSGSDPLGADLLSQDHQTGKLQLCVARNAGDRSAPRKVSFHEWADDPALELILEIEHIKREAQLFGDTPRVVDIIERAAARRLRLAVGRQSPPLVPQLHREADDVVTLVLQECSRDRTIDAAAHCYCYVHAC
jgi:hypothetical protein